MAKKTAINANSLKKTSKPKRTSIRNCQIILNKSNRNTFRYKRHKTTNQIRKINKRKKFKPKEFTIQTHHKTNQKQQTNTVS